MTAQTPRSEKSEPEQSPEMVRSAESELLAGLCMGRQAMSHFLGHIHICVCFVAQEDPGTASGGQERAERTSPSCAFCLRVLEW